MRIEHLLTVNRAILAVYHTDGKCYQFSVTLSDGGIYQTDEIFYTADAALQAGIEEIRITIDYQ